MAKSNRDLVRPVTRAEQLNSRYERQIHRLAPVVRFHPEENYFVMEPMEFIRQSRFRHHKGGADEGYNKKLEKWKETNSRHENYYDIPVDYINGYGLNDNGKNRRPRDKKRGKRWNVFLQPEGHPRGDSSPTGTVPTFYYVKTVYEVPLITYWWFMGYNDGQVAGFASHQGDWEHVTIRVMDDEVEGVWFAGHGKPARYHSRNQLRMTNQRPTVYCANGTHASYPRVGGFNTVFNLDQTGNGTIWQTWKNLQPLVDQPWRDYAGAWGEVGEFAHTTGPLGPWYKRKNK
ncbi:Vps62-related protein [bacterium]|nr:Vps62-related protein [bacterium]